MTLEEIARLAGVSRSTVSRVVNGDRRVSDAARARVQEVIQRTNFHPNAAARSLASRRTRVLGLLITKAVGGLFIMVVGYGLARAFTRAGRRPVSPPPDAGPSIEATGAPRPLPGT